MESRELVYTKLLEVLPCLNKQLDYVKNFKSEKEFFFNTEENEFFIEPIFSINNDFNNFDQPQVVLISASGAVGKSTLAKQLSFDKNAPIFNLSECETVGKNSFTGTIASSFDDNYLDMLQDFKEGKIFFIVDALDEGRMKTKEEGFSAFIKDIANVAKRSNNVSFVLLGRNQIIEDVWIELDDSNVQTMTLNIEPFTEKNALTYIDKKVQNFFNDRKNFEQYRTSYEDARDSIYSQLKNAIHASDLESEENKFFLGYAPVLDAIATLLSREDNYMKLKEVFKRNNPDSSRAVLIEIVQYILSREQKEKLIPNFKKSIEQVATQLGWSEWEKLYTMEEQSVRLLAKKNNINPSFFDNSIPQEIWSEYEESLKSWFMDHPFLNGDGFANIVFESYVLAKVLNNSDNDIRKIAEDYVNSFTFKDFPLLADFYYFFCKDNNGVLHSNHVGYLYESLQSFMPNHYTLDFYIEGTEPVNDEDTTEESEDDEEIDCKFILSKKNNSEQDYIMEFRIPNTSSSKIRFRRALRNARIIVPFDVELGHPQLEEYEISSNTFVRCKNLVINSRQMVIIGKKQTRLQEENSSQLEEPFVILHAENYEGIVEEKPQAHIKFEVTWKGSNHYPWAEYSKNIEIPKDIDQEVFRRFRRIVLTLRSHSKGELARYTDKVEHRRILQGDVGRAILEKLLSDGILIKRLSDKMYVWEPKKADELLGINWLSLRNGYLSDKLNSYLSIFSSEKV